MQEPRHYLIVLKEIKNLLLLHGIKRIIGSQIKLLTIKIG
jgi:hypothetical protein